MPFRLPWPRRRTEQPPCNAPLAEGETILRGQRSVLVYGRERKRGALHLTTRRLIFEADRGGARWLIIPLEEVARAGAYRSPGSAACQLWIETTKGEQAPFAMSRDQAQSWVEAIEAARRSVTGERLLE
jgi:hypothetical protein